MCFLRPRRSRFIMLDIVYKAKNDRRNSFRLSVEARVELKLLIDLAPLMTAHTSFQIGELVISTDACDDGGAVVYT